MLEAAKEAVQLTRGETKESVQKNRILELALVQLIEIIGEAASKVSKERQAQLSQIEWPQIIGMRNRLIHAYYKVDHNRVWGTIINSLPGLISELEIILLQSPSDDALPPNSESENSE